MLKYMDIKEYIKRGLYYIVKGVPEKHITAVVSQISPSQRLEGKNIIVTGGGRGLGFAMAKKFVDEGANVLIAGRNKEVLDQSAAILKCRYLELDLADISSFPIFLEKSKKILGDIDCLVNNAGLSLHEKSFLSVTPESFDEQFSTNLRGPFFLTQQFISKTLQEGDSEKKKYILFISSETSQTADDRPYGLTKVALNSLLQGIACRYIKSNFKINGIAPGVTASDMTGYSSSGNLYLEDNPSDRVFLSEEIAEIASFLLSDASNIINGQIIVCNEGKTIKTRW